MTPEEDGVAEEEDAPDDRLGGSGRCALEPTEWLSDELLRVVVGKVNNSSLSDESFNLTLNVAKLLQF